MRVRRRGEPVRETGRGSSVRAFGVLLKRLLWERKETVRTFTLNLHGLVCCRLVSTPAECFLCEVPKATADPSTPSASRTTLRMTILLRKLVAQGMQKGLLRRAALLKRT